jgi:hypothetical protein
MQIKTTIRQHFTFTRRARIKKPENNPCQQGCGDTGALLLADGNVKWYSYFGKWPDTF